MTRKHAVAPAIAILLAYSQVCAQGDLVRFDVVGDAIPRALTSEPGDAARGRRFVVDRDAGACTLCHAVPGEASFGNIAPSLAGVGARLSPAQLRLRVADSTRVNPESPMPAYYRTEGLNQVAAAFRGKPLLSAQQVEDVVAWLATLKGPQ
ncbi:MAG TPA: sulfur oxidation c-type cytochrome SoxX [Burkholderiales bacterium]|nr:sulfur oxidation c-type cytochrome SoxX [Burkholderiales bacterium]